MSQNSNLSSPTLGKVTNNERFPDPIIEQADLCSKIQSVLPILLSPGESIISTNTDQHGESHKQITCDNQKIVIRPGIIYPNDESISQVDCDGPCPKYNQLVEAINSIDRLPCNIATVYMDKPKNNTNHLSFAHRKNISTRQYMNMIEHQNRQTERSLLSPAILNMNVKIDGGIAAGKSTLGQHLKTYCDWLDVNVILVSENNIINPLLLSSFLNDKSKYAFIFQIHVLMGRIHEQTQAYHKKLTQFTLEGEPCILFFDRTSLTGDMAFAMNNYMSGNISKEQIDKYYNPLATLLNKHLSTICHTTNAHNYIEYLSWVNDQIAILMSIYQSCQHFTADAFTKRVEQCVSGILASLNNRKLPFPTQPNDLNIQNNLNNNNLPVSHPFHPLNYFNQHDINILLTTKVAECKKRIVLRGNKDEINGYNDEYLRLLDMIHKYIYSSSIRSNQETGENLHQNNLQKLAFVDNELGVFDNLIKKYKGSLDVPIEIVGVKTKVAFATLEWETPLNRCMDELTSLRKEEEEKRKKHTIDQNHILDNSDIEVVDDCDPNFDNRTIMDADHPNFGQKQKQKKKTTIPAPIKQLIHFFFQAVHISMVNGPASISDK